MSAKTNVAIVKMIYAAKQPECCGQPMDRVFLNFGGKTSEERNAMGRQEYAAYICSQPLPPVFECKACHKEQKIEGLEAVWPEQPWPEGERPEPAVKPIAEPVGKLCPHCGQEIPA